jgi:Zn-dependent peptidase ImmA (M78 family)
MTMSDRDESPLAVVARFQVAPPVSVGDIANALGIRVIRRSLGSEVAGMIMRDPSAGNRSGFVIYINSDDHINRQRFTAAHELAHYILHRDLIENGVVDDTMYRSKELSSTYETQANQLAADILMPIRLVKKWRELLPNVKDLAKKFGVSEQAMSIRLSGIGSVHGTAKNSPGNVVF